MVLVDLAALENKMSKEIVITQQQVLASAQKKVEEFKNLPKHQLEELLHEAEENLFNETFSLRTAAEIVRYACQKNLGMV